MGSKQESFMDLKIVFRSNMITSTPKFLSRPRLEAGN